MEDADTVVVYMAGRTGAAVGREFIAAGRSGDTPVAVITDASLPRQRVEILDLATLGTRGVELRAGAPVIIVVGDVVRLSPKLDRRLVEVPRWPAS
jgi:siroheme synthase